MQIHANAKLVPSTRVLLVRRVLEEHWKVAEVAAGFGVSERTVYRWLARWRAGDRRLFDRSSAPKRVPGRTPASVEALIEQLRRLRMTSTRIAAELQMAVSTVGAVLARLGLNRLSRLEPPEPANRYERRHPGELIHLDVKKLGRFDSPGHRVTGRSAPGARAPTRHDRQRGTLSIHRFRAELLTPRDQAPPHPSLPTAHQRQSIERFIQTMLREWAYAAVYPNSQHRALALTPWLEYYNHRRPHGALSHQPPATRLAA